MPDFPPDVRYLVVPADADGIEPLRPSHATRQPAQQEVDYWARWTPDSPCFVVEAVTTYRVLAASAARKPKDKLVPAQRSS